MRTGEPAPRPMGSAMLSGGVFLIAFSLLMVVTLSVRGAQVAFGKDFLFFIIPLTFLGIGVGGVCAYFSKEVSRSRGLIACALAYVLFVALIFVSAAHVQGSLGRPLGMGFFFVASFAAYVCGSWAIASILDLRNAHAPVLYFLDLLGASAGAIAAAVLLNVFGYEHAVVATIFFAALPLVAFLAAGGPRRAVLVFICAASLAAFAWVYGPHQMLRIACVNMPIESSYTATNSFSQINIRSLLLQYQQELGVDEFGTTPRRKARFLDVDCGSFGTPLVPASEADGIDFLRHSLRSIPLAFAQERFGRDMRVLVPSSGAGIDVTRARLFTDGPIEAVEFNPNIIAATRSFSSTSSYPYSFDNVTLHTTDARRFIETSTKEYEVILLGKIGLYGNIAADTNSPTYANTIEALSAYLPRLAPSGVFAYTSIPSERGPTASVIAALAYAGLDPVGRVIHVRGREGIEDLILAQQDAFSTSDIQSIRALSEARGFTVSIPDERTIEEDYLSIPVTITDDRPYISTIDYYGFESVTLWSLLKIIGLVAILVILAAVGMVVLRERMYAGRHMVSIAFFSIYVAAIGFGFTFFQLGAMQKLFLPIAEPASAVAVTLASFLFFSGLGSLATYRLPERWFARTIAIGTVILCTYLLVAANIGNDVLRALLEYEFLARAVLSGLVIALPAFVLGIFLPIGLRAAARISSGLVPWTWALDGLFSVAGGLAAKSLFFLVGIHLTFPVTAAAYAAAAFSFIAYMLVRTSEDR